MEGQAFELMLESSQEFYAKIRKEHNVSITSSVREIVDDVVIYTVAGHIGDRHDSAAGVSSLENLKGIDKANAFKSAETQAKNRLTTSLTGIKWLGDAVAKVAEPAAPEQPAVNDAPAEVVADTRGPALRTEDYVASPPGMPLPIVSEQQLATLHAESAKFNEQTQPIQEMTEHPSLQVGPQGGIFDEAPEVLVIPAPQVQAAAIVTFDAVEAAANPPTETGVSMPVPQEKPANQPTRLQYQAFTVRCTKLVRDVLPKTGDKTAPGLLLPYLRKTFGVKDLTPETTLNSVWESTLSKLETAASPAELLKILKG